MLQKLQGPSALPFDTNLITDIDGSQNAKKRRTKNCPNDILKGTKHV